MSMDLAVCYDHIHPYQTSYRDTISSKTPSLKASKLDAFPKTYNLTIRCVFPKVHSGYCIENNLEECSMDEG